MAKTEEFLLSEPLWYRAVYIIPLFTSFRFRLAIAFILSECACVTAQLGAYPATCKSRPGQGPTNHSALEQRSVVKSMYVTSTLNALDYA